MLEVRFQDCTEIRMGSPFRVCQLALRGPWIPTLGNHEWQDVTATSPDGRFVGLVYWDTVRNEPGFHIVTVDCSNQRVAISARLSGCCQGLAWTGDTFEARVFRDAASR